MREAGRGQKSERTSQSLGFTILYQGPEHTSARAGQHKDIGRGKGHLPQHQDPSRLEIHLTQQEIIPPLSSSVYTGLR